MERWPGVGVGVGVTVAGVELNNNTALTIRSERSIFELETCRIFAKNTKMRRNFTEKWRNCGWSETQQQHSKHETKRTMIRMTSKPVEFSRKNTKMRSVFAAKWRKLWLE
jgi:hypothetical protein